MNKHCKQIFKQIEFFNEFFLWFSWFLSVKSLLCPTTENRRLTIRLTIRLNLRWKQPFLRRFQFCLNLNVWAKLSVWLKFVNLIKWQTHSIKHFGMNSFWVMNIHVRFSQKFNIFCSCQHLGPTKTKELSKLTFFSCGIKQSFKTQK